MKKKDEREREIEEDGKMKENTGKEDGFKEWLEEKNLRKRAQRQKEEIGKQKEKEKEEMKLFEKEQAKFAKLKERQERLAKVKTNPQSVQKKEISVMKANFPLLLSYSTSKTLKSK